MLTDIPFEGSKFSAPSYDRLIGELIQLITEGNTDDVRFLEFESVPRNSRDFYIPHNVLSIELCGISDSGKTSVADELIAELQEEGVECHFWSEFTVAGQLNIRIRQVVFEAVVGLKIENDYVFKDKLIELLECLKLLSLNDYVENLKKSIGEHGRSSKSRIVHILERGPNDYLALAGWALEYIKISDYKLGKNTNLQPFYENITFALACTQYFQSVAMFYINNLETILERRNLQGRKHKGVMGNDIDFYPVNRGYKRWLKYLYPPINCGLITVDGERRLEENVARLKKYILGHFDEEFAEDRI